MHRIVVVILVSSPSSVSKPLNAKSLGFVENISITFIRTLDKKDNDEIYGRKAVLQLAIMIKWTLSSAKHLLWLPGRRLAKHFRCNKHKSTLSKAAHSHQVRSQNELRTNEHAKEKERESQKANKFLSVVTAYRYFHFEHFDNLFAIKENFPLATKATTRA